MKRWLLGWGIAGMVVVAATPVWSSPTVTAESRLTYRDCGLGVVTVEGRHRMFIADPTVDEIGEELVVAGDLWTCQPSTDQLISPIGYSCAADMIVTQTRPLYCYTTSDVRCRSHPGALARTYGGLPPTIYRSNSSRCKKADCADGSFVPPPKRERVDR